MTTKQISTLTDFLSALRSTAISVSEYPRILSCDQSPSAIAAVAKESDIDNCVTRMRPACFCMQQSLPLADVFANAQKSIQASPEKPFVIAIKEFGLVACAQTRTLADHMISCFIEGKRLEDSYVSVAEACLSDGRLSGTTAIITGSAQGFGKGIAEGLAAEGAYVTIADLNDQLGNELVTQLNAQYKETRAIFCHTDVTKLDSLDACLEKTVAAFGGVDMFISNAGVLKAGSLEEMDEAGFDLVTNVNYKAYFLCVKSVSRLMKWQHSFCNDYYMDIVQINSKSGLEGSNKNFAYAGGKFGGIGLTQSFALELLPFNIKVNAICPGNYFEGPLWNDPVKGLFVQYLKAGKVPGAKTVSDVRQYYIDKVPMKRGCYPADVVRAIVYCHEQKYETGQAVPVTGGQIMLS